MRPDVETTGRESTRAASRVRAEDESSHSRASSALATLSSWPCPRPNLGGASPARGTAKARAAGAATPRSPRRARPGVSRWPESRRSSSTGRDPSPSSCTTSSPRRPAAPPTPGSTSAPHQFRDEVRFLRRPRLRGRDALAAARRLAGQDDPAAQTESCSRSTTATGAWPSTPRRILRRYGWPAVLDLALTHLGHDRDLTVAMVRRLLGDGWEVASHTMTHPDLTTLDTARLLVRGATARGRCSADFDVPVDFFCYPPGDYNTDTVRDVRRAGYLGALTTRPGSGGSRRAASTPSRACA